MKKILFPTDGSENAKQALNYAVDVAKKFGSEIVILHTYDVAGNLSNVMGRYGTTYTYFQELEKSLSDHGQAILDTVNNELMAKEIKTEIVLIKGSPEHEIITQAKSHNCDLIIMGSRGHGRLKSLLIGSVSDYVIHHSDIPVLLINN